jgi:hypothetical protein
MNRGNWGNMSIIDNMKTIALSSISTLVELYEITFMVSMLHAKLRDFSGMITVVFIASFSEKYGLDYK